MKFRVASSVSSASPQGARRAGQLETKFRFPHVAAAVGPICLGSARRPLHPYCRHPAAVHCKRGGYDRDAKLDRPVSELREQSVTRRGLGMHVLPNDIEIRQVDRSQDLVLRNLLNLYLHDLAKWFLFDSDDDGKYSYATAPLWEGGVDVHLAYHGRIPIGLGLVGSADAYTEEPYAKDLVEFFVVRRYRRAGLGRALATHIWDLYRGPWIVRVYQRNVPALPFWRTAISTYTGGRFHEEVLNVREVMTF